MSDERYKPQKRGPSFNVKVRDPVNPEQKVSITGPSRAEVAAKAESIARVRRDVRAGEISPREAASIMRRKSGTGLRVEDIWLRYVASQSPTWAKQARSVWTNQLFPTFGDLLAWDVDDTAIRTWELELRRGGYADTTIRGAYDCLAAAYRRAVADGWIDRVPWRADGPGAYRPGKSTRTARIEAHEAGAEREACRSWEEAQELIRAASAYDREIIATGRFSDVAYRLAIMMLCGLRQGEAAALGWDRVEIDGGTMAMRVEVQATDGWRVRHPEWTRPMDLPKGRKVRTLALAPGAAGALYAQRENLRRFGLYAPDGPVFPRYVKEPGVARWRTHASTIKPELIRELVKRAGLPNVERWVTHSMRHSFTTLEVALSGGDLRTVQKRTGHSDIRMVETYLHTATRGRLVPSFTPALSEGVLRDPREAPPPRLLVAGDEHPEPELRHESARILDAVAMHARAEGEALDIANQRRAARRERANARARGHRKHRRSVFEPLIRAWLEAGAPGLRPAAITEAGNRAYDARLKKELRAGATKDRAIKAASGAKKAQFAAFARVLKRMQQAGGELPRTGTDE